MSENVMMESDRWERVAELFGQCLELTPAEREVLLDRECADDGALRTEVQHLLNEDSGCDGFLEDPSFLNEPGLLQPVSDLSGEWIGEYRVIEELGAGGMGVVYRVEQEKPPVALRLSRLFDPATPPKKYCAGSNTRAQVLGHLQHPGIAQIFGAGTADLGSGPQPYFAMEYIDGLPLDEYASQNKLSTDDRLRLLVRISDAIQHAHQRGRDPPRSQTSQHSDQRPWRTQSGRLRRGARDRRRCSSHHTADRHGSS